MNEVFSKGGLPRVGQRQLLQRAPNDAPGRRPASDWHGSGGAEAGIGPICGQGLFGSSGVVGRGPASDKGPGTGGLWPEQSSLTELEWRNDGALLPSTFPAQTPLNRSKSCCKWALLVWDRWGEAGGVPDKWWQPPGWGRAWGELGQLRRPRG